MPNRGDIVTIEWWYNKKPSSRSETTGTFFGFRANGDAEVIGPDGRHYVGDLVEEASANARLIAAAPELLEACKAAAEHTYPNLADAEDLTPADEECWNMLLAAIAKAEVQP